ncbi:hypothetical protein E2C01_062016 [Portunus trituberculatus]|uniref:Uncharacterized protein n=1 Tax=Portunus trituberculatus TaxID=210409 RepID=A0A5B7H6T4_PORTR|nr:hypothetical protein [Portunus trituberculatus]
MIICNFPPPCQRAYLASPRWGVSPVRSPTSWPATHLLRLLCEYAEAPRFRLCGVPQTGGDGNGGGEQEQGWRGTGREVTALLCLPYPCLYA